MSVSSGAKPVDSGASEEEEEEKAEEEMVEEEKRGEEVVVELTPAALVGKGEVEEEGWEEAGACAVDAACEVREDGREEAGEEDAGEADGAGEAEVVEGEERPGVLVGVEGVEEGVGMEDGERVEEGKGVEEGAGMEDGEELRPVRAREGELEEEGLVGGEVAGETAGAEEGEGVEEGEGMDEGEGVEEELDDAWRREGRVRRARQSSATAQRRGNLRGTTEVEPAMVGDGERAEAATTLTRRVREGEVRTVQRG